MRLKVSIALCTYNGAKYLSPQLESYLDQTYLPNELVVCDDRSQDETGGLLSDFAVRAPFPVRIQVNHRNLGSTKNFEKAISLCSGDIICLSDQDDVWMPNKIEKTVNEFCHNHKVGMVFTDANLVDNALRLLERSLFGSSFNAILTHKEKGLIEKGNLFSILLKRNIVTGATLSFRSEYRSIIAPIPTDIPDMIHDGWIAMIISTVAKSAFIDEPLIKYRQHNEQQIGVTNYVTEVFKLAWKDAIEGTERKRKTEKERLELIKSHITSRIDSPVHVLNALNNEIQYQHEYSRHYRLRKGLPGNHALRVLPVVKELLSGRYHRFSNGIRSAIRDMAIDHSRETDFYEMIDKRKRVGGG